MVTFIKLLHILVSILLCAAVVLQSKGSGLSAVFGGDGEFHSTKRGGEKFMHNATIVLVTLFILLAIAISILTK